jgi:hypothetical protein
VHADFLESRWVREDGLLLPGSEVSSIVTARAELAAAI